MTTWNAQVAPTVTPATWSALDASFPPMIDGGDANMLAWLGVYDGGGAVEATSDIAAGTAPQLTLWTAQSGPT